MRSSKIIHIVTCHAEGEVGDVIVGGVAPPPGDTVWEQSRWIAKDETLRNFVINEPRGGVFRHVNLLVPPKNPKAQMGWMFVHHPAIARRWAHETKSIKRLPRKVRRSSKKKARRWSSTPTRASRSLRPATSW